MDEVYNCDFLEVVDKKWTLTRTLPFKTRYGYIEAPEGFNTDLYSVVPNTRYPDFWKASILHDLLYAEIRAKNPNRMVKHKWQADLCLYDEMLIQSAVVFGKLQNYVGTEMAIDEFRKLLRTSKVYYYGVSGIFGRVYQFFVD